jgi:3-hydroxyisobutyrate dehydrogenase
MKRNLDMQQRLAFIGLGTMGFPMAGHLAKAGHEVTVYNRTAAKATRWVEAHGGRSAPTPAAAADGAAIVFTCVGRDEDVREIAAPPQGVLATMEPGSILVDHSTTSAELARAMHREAGAQGVAFIDAPISGGQSGAESGRLSVMAGGDEEAFARAAPVIGAYARIAKRIGPPGSGQLTKMVNQICIAGLVQSLAEALHFARAAGLDTEAVIEVISKGAAQSWQMENRHGTMVEGRFDFGFAVDWMRKDLGYTLDEARRNGAKLPVAALVDQFYAAVQAIGGGRWDTSSLIALLEEEGSGVRGRVPVEE